MAIQHRSDGNLDDVERAASLLAARMAEFKLIPWPQLRPRLIATWSALVLIAVTLSPGSRTIASSESLQFGVKITEAGRFDITGLISASEWSSQRRADGAWVGGQLRNFSFHRRGGGQFIWTDLERALYQSNRYQVSRNSRRANPRYRLQVMVHGTASRPGSISFSKDVRLRSGATNYFRTFEARDFKMGGEKAKAVRYITSTSAGNQVLELHLWFERRPDASFVAPANPETTHTRREPSGGRYQRPTSVSSSEYFVEFLYSGQQIRQLRWQRPKTMPLAIEREFQGRFDRVRILTDFGVIELGEIPGNELDYEDLFRPLEVRTIVSNTRGPLANTDIVLRFGLRSEEFWVYTRGVTDSTGVARLNIPAWSRDGVAYPKWWVIAAKGGYGRVLRPLEPNTGSLEVEMAPYVERPVEIRTQAGVFVTVFFEDDQNVFFSGAADREGRINIPGDLFRWDPPLKATFEKEGYALSLKLLTPDLESRQIILDPRPTSVNVSRISFADREEFERLGGSLASLLVRAFSRGDDVYFERSPELTEWFSDRVSAYQLIDSERGFRFRRAIVPSTATAVTVQYIPDGRTQDVTLSVQSESGSTLTNVAFQVDGQRNSSVGSSMPLYFTYDSRTKAYVAKSVAACKAGYVGQTRSANPGNLKLSFLLSPIRPETIVVVAGNLSASRMSENLYDEAMTAVLQTAGDFRYGIANNGDFNVAASASAIARIGLSPDATNRHVTQELQDAEGLFRGVRDVCGNVPERRLVYIAAGLDAANLENTSLSPAGSNRNTRTVISPDRRLPGWGEDNWIRLGPDPDEAVIRRLLGQIIGG